MSLNPSFAVTGSEVDTEDWGLLFSAIQLRLSQTIALLPAADHGEARHEVHATMLDCMQALEHLLRTALVELDRRQTALDQALQVLPQASNPPR